jgi:folylpolyglutamate synthase/dihydropteroate synthase
VGEDALRRGLARVDWPARLEVLQSGPWLVVDAAHTIESVEAALSTIGELFGRAPDVVIFGVYADKDVAGMLSQVPQTSRLILSQAAHPRAMDIDQLRTLADPFSGEILATPSPREALERALAEAAAEDIILVIGSLFLAAEARAEWCAIKGLPMPLHDPA